jgi:hypothetical protein
VTVPDTSACLYGCTLHDHHTSDCPGDCNGCLPRPADTGLLCAGCYAKLTEAVTSSPELLVRLHALGTPDAGARALTDDIFNRRDPAESTILPPQWLDEDELSRLLGSWALLILDEHPVRGMRGPNAAPWNGDTAAWFLPHLPWCATREWAGEMRRELVGFVAQLRHRWPGVDDAEPPRHVDIPCPRCDLISLVYTPPRYGGQAFRVECTDPDCARVFSEAEWERFRALALRVGRVGAA